MKQCDISGQHFGRLTALRLVPRKSRGSSRWLCRCDCGVEKEVDYNNLTTKKQPTRSCGCLRKEITRERARKPIEHVIATQVWNYYVRNSKMRGVGWCLTKEEFSRLIFAPCWYCGIVGGTTTNTTWSSKGGARRSLANNGVDRIDSAGPYVLTNCVTACKNCNVAKNDMTQSEFLTWAQRLAEHQRFSCVKFV